MKQFRTFDIQPDVTLWNGKTRKPMYSRVSARFRGGTLHVLTSDSINDPVSLVDGTNYLRSVLDEDDHQFQVILIEQLNAIKRVFCKIENRILLFANGFSHLTLDTTHTECCDSLPPGTFQTPVSGRETAATAMWRRK